MLLLREHPTAKHPELPLLPQRQERRGQGTSKKPGEGGPHLGPLLAKAGAQAGEGRGSQPPTLPHITGFADRARNADCDLLQ